VKTGIQKNMVHASRLDSGVRRNDEMTHLLSDGVDVLYFGLSMLTFSYFQGILINADRWGSVLLP